jgi:hypothetical protein
MASARASQQVGRAAPPARATQQSFRLQRLVLLLLLLLVLVLVIVAAVVLKDMRLAPPRDGSSGGLQHQLAAGAAADVDVAGTAPAWGVRGLCALRMRRPLGPLLLLLLLERLERLDSGNAAGAAVDADGVAGAVEPAGTAEL